MRISTQPLATRRALRLTVSLAALASLLTLLLSGCSFGTSSTSTSSNGGKLTKVTLALDFAPNTNHTGIFVAQQKGWYRQNGIDLNILPLGQTAPEQLVEAHQADFAISYTEAVTVERGKGQPLVSLAAIIQHNTSALVTLKSSGLNSVAKLAGKTYAGFYAPSYEKPVISLALACGGASNTNFNDVDTSVDAIQALKSGKWDFAWIFSGWTGIEAQRAGVALNTFPITDYCIPDYYTPVIVTNDSMIKQQPDVVKRFMKATAEGYTYAIQHPKEAADLLIQGAPKGSFDDKQFIYDSQSYLSQRYAQDAKCWGFQTLDKWTNYPRFMYNHGAILDANGNPLKTEPDYASAFTNQFLPSC
ncbi:MAG TPA: ABC transporter substrate-binding protein [Ktedonobacterales bacterium]